MDPVEAYLQRYGPSLSSDVTAHLVKTLNLKPPAARQRVSRSPKVKELSGLPFPRRARFLYLQEQFGSPRYWDALGAALIKTNSAYGFAIAALRQREGVVSLKQFPIVCGAPTRQSKHLAPETILARLEGAGLVSRLTLRGVGDCVGLVQVEGHYDWLGDHLHAKAISEGILLLALRDWLRNLNLASYNAIRVRGDETAPRVGTLLWDLSGPSYVYPLTRSGKGGGRNGFVACDVLLGETMTAAGVAPFLRKCTTLRGLRNVGACLQILVADRFDAAAFAALKSAGVVPATPAGLFGEEIAESLRELTSVLESAARNVIDPERFETLFRALGKINGADNQLRGTLFEYLAAEVARRTLGSNVQMNRLFKDTEGLEAEADVVAVWPDQGITIIECKGYSPRGDIPDDKFKRWLQYNVPVCFRSIKLHPDWKNFTPHFEFWATGRLSPDALALFEQVQSSVNPGRYTLGLRQNARLHEDCRTTGDPTLLRAFEKHFTVPPAALW